VGLNNSRGQLLDDRQSTNRAYRLILTTHALAAFQLVAIDVRSNRTSACNVTPGIGNDGVGTQNVMADVGDDDRSIQSIAVRIGDSGVLVRTVLVSVRNGCTRARSKFSLEAEG
jgi:hypothetical protein